MASSSEQNENRGEEGGSSPAGWLLEKYRKTRDNVEAYPYVWASYVLVYGGFTLWMTYRYRKLRRTEDRVRVLQDKLRKVVEANESKTSSSAAASVSSSSSPSGPSSSPVKKSDPAK